MVCQRFEVSAGLRIPVVRLSAVAVVHPVILTAAQSDDDASAGIHAQYVRGEIGGGKIPRAIKIRSVGSAVAGATAVERLLRVKRRAIKHGLTSFH